MAPRGEKPGPWTLGLALGPFGSARTREESKTRITLNWNRRVTRFERVLTRISNGGHV